MQIKPVAAALLVPVSARWFPLPWSQPCPCFKVSVCPVSLEPCTSAWYQHLWVCSGNQRGWTSWTLMTPALWERQGPCYQWALVRSGGEPSGTLGDKAPTAAEALSPGHRVAIPRTTPACKQGRQLQCRKEGRVEVGSRRTRSTLTGEHHSLISLAATFQGSSSSVLQLRYHTQHLKW